MASKRRDRQWMYKCNNEARSRNHCCYGRGISIAQFWVFVCVALVIRHAELMRGIISSSVAYPALPYFSTLSHKQHDSREKRVLTFSVTSAWNISHSKKNVSKHCHKYHMSICILVRFQWHLNLLDRFKKKNKFHENSSSGSRVVPRRQTDGRADRQTWQS